MKLHQDLTRVRALVSQLLRDISTTQPAVVPPESVATLLLERVALRRYVGSEVSQFNFLASLFLARVKMLQFLSLPLPVLLD